MSDTSDIKLHQAAERVAEMVIKQSQAFCNPLDYKRHIQMWLPRDVQQTIGKLVRADGWQWSKRGTFTRRFADELQVILRHKLPYEDPKVTSGTRSIAVRLG